MGIKSKSLISRNMLQMHSCIELDNTGEELIDVLSHHYGVQIIHHNNAQYCHNVWRQWLYNLPTSQMTSEETATL